MAKKLYQNPVDHKLDLGFVNFVQHPENPQYIVYRFVDINRASDFESQLKEHEVWFEKGEEDKRNTKYFLYGVHKNDFKITQNFNFSVEAKNKKPFIPVAWLRYFLLIVSAIAMSLAILGYCKAQEKLRQVNESSTIEKENDRSFNIIDLT